MDILNFISWIASKRRVVTSAPDDALVPIGIRTETRDDKYTTVAIKKSDLITAPEPTYKVYTALLSQVGGSFSNYLYSGSLVKGVSYTVTSATSNCDFTNVGGPSGVSGAGLSFVATENLEPNNWDGSELEYNEGAPVVTVLENTIGNIWFTYNSIGYYEIQLSNPIDVDKTFLYIGNGPTVGGTIFYEESAFKTISFPGSSGTASTLILFTSIDGFGSGFTDGKLNKTPIEIRVYN